jgi:hypothetical protein
MRYLFASPISTVITLHVVVFPGKKSEKTKNAFYGVVVVRSAAVSFYLLPTFRKKINDGF